MQVCYGKVFAFVVMPIIRHLMANLWRGRPPESFASIILNDPIVEVQGPIPNYLHFERVVADGHIPWACEAISRLHGQDLSWFAMVLEVIND